MTNVDDTLPPGPTVCHYCTKPLDRTVVYLDERSGPLHPQCSAALAQRRMRAKEKESRNWFSSWIRAFFVGGER